MRSQKTFILIFILIFISSTYAYSSLKEELYDAFLSHDESKWQSATLKFEKKANLNNTADLLQLIHCYYGWTSELIDNKQQEKAETNIAKANTWIDKILQKEPNNATAINYKGVFMSYELSFNKLKAPTVGPQSLSLIKKAYSIDPNNVQVIFDMGNAYYYPPKIFGGSKKDALTYFQKAINILEKQNNTTHNWMYVQLLMLEARCQDLLGNTKAAKSGYEKTLKVEPNFKIVRDTYYPNLLKKIK